jgi:hypothetical protein
MMASTTDVVLAIDEQGSDEQRLEELALQLREELLQLDAVRSVEPLTGGDAPEGTRSALALVAGSLVTGLASGKVQAVVGLVLDWLRRAGGGRTVRVEMDGDVLELHGASSEVQTKLVEDWLLKHAPS